jgi:hypothetical protein
MRSVPPRSLRDACAAAIAADDSQVAGLIARPSLFPVHRSTFAVPSRSLRLCLSGLLLCLGFLLLLLRLQLYLLLLCFLILRRLLLLLLLLLRCLILRRLLRYRQTTVKQGQRERIPDRTVELMRTLRSSFRLRLSQANKRLIVTYMTPWFRTWTQKHLSWLRTMGDVNLHMPERLAHIIPRPRLMAETCCQQNGTWSISWHWVFPSLV